MNRREFLAAAGASVLTAHLGSREVRGEAAGPAAAGELRWRRHEASKLFDLVTVNGQPWLNPESGPGLGEGWLQLIEDGKPGLETVFGCRQPKGQSGPVHVTLSHQLLRSAGTREDLLEVTLTLQNRSDKPCEVAAGFQTGARPGRAAGDHEVYVPLSAAGLRDPEDDPRKRLKDCHQSIGAGDFLAHYLEPQASDPRHATTRAVLLAPVADVFAKAAPGRVALFGRSVDPLCFEATPRAWRVSRRLRLEAGRTEVVRVFLLVHFGDAPEAWRAFHRFGHQEDFPAIAWPREVKVHYFDFLSGVEADGPRGGGYDADLKHFAEFHVGMATQHGYYLGYGDFIHPDRKEWPAMPKDAAGPVPMSFEKLRARVEATRRAGVRPAIYMHYTILDEGSPLFERMRDSVLVDAAGKPALFGWEGPDVIKTTWKMSHTSPQWRDHLVQQAQWIMELLKPDAIVLDETFTAWGWDHHKSHGGPLSQGGIDLMRRLRAVVRSFGPDKALFASDCSMSNFCLWGDGEGGDHCYDRLLGQDLYRRPPVRYLAPLGDKAWLPCAWLFKSLWPVQVDLARQAGAAVGVTNGWGDNLGLTRLPQDAKTQMLRDIAALTKA